MLQGLIKAFMPPKKMIDMFTYNVKSSQSIKEITERAPILFEKYKFSLLHTYNYHEIVESNGFPIQRKVFIYEICQARPASIMLTEHPYFSIFMPCKVVVYEENEKVLISTMDMKIMLNAVKTNKELYKDAVNLFETMKSLMMELSKNE
jgi:uncharacterized protein (DUF302 family)